MMQSQETRDYMQVATPIQAQPATPVVALENAMKQLNGCRSDADIQALSSSVEKIMLELSGVSHESGDVLKAMKASELALKNAGQTVKSSRISKMRKLFAKLPKQSPKKQRKMLREILALTKKNLGMKVVKRGFCGASLSCNAAMVTGSVLVLAGATAVISMAAMGHFEAPEDVVKDDMTNVGEATEEPAQHDDVAANVVPQDSEELEMTEISRRRDLLANPDNMWSRERITERALELRTKIEDVSSDDLKVWVFPRKEGTEFKLTSYLAKVPNDPAHLEMTADYFLARMINVQAYFIQDGYTETLQDEVKFVDAFETLVEAQHSHWMRFMQEDNAGQLLVEDQLSAGVESVQEDNAAQSLVEDQQSAVESVQEDNATLDSGIERREPNQPIVIDEDEVNEIIETKLDDKGIARSDEIINDNKLRKLVTKKLEAEAKLDRMKGNPDEFIGKKMKRYNRLNKNLTRFDTNIEDYLERKYDLSVQDAGPGDSLNFGLHVYIEDFESDNELLQRVVRGEMTIAEYHATFQ